MDISTLKVTCKPKKRRIEGEDDDTLATISTLRITETKSEKFSLNLNPQEIKCKFVTIIHIKI